jgi:hypothetical protein
VKIEAEGGDVATDQLLDGPGRHWVGSEFVAVEAARRACGSLLPTADPIEAARMSVESP